jgi:hypothetical protein
VVYAPVNHETDTNYHHALKPADKGLVIGIAVLALYVLDGNCKISRCGARRLRENKAGRQGDRSVREIYAARRVPAPSIDGCAGGSPESYSVVDILRKMLLVSP